MTFDKAKQILMQKLPTYDKDTQDAIVWLIGELHKWHPTLEQIMHGGEPDPMDELAMRRGWNPLTVGEKMIISFNGRGRTRYEIERIE